MRCVNWRRVLQMGLAVMAVIVMAVIDVETCSHHPETVAASDQEEVIQEPEFTDYRILQEAPVYGDDDMGSAQ